VAASGSTQTTGDEPAVPSLRAPGDHVGNDSDEEPAFNCGHLTDVNAGPDAILLTGSR
jgi:hypothetical protein